MKLFTLAVLAYLVLSISGIAWGLNEYVFEPEEYLIYSTAIDSWCGDDKLAEIFIRDHTAIYQSGQPVETELNYLREKMPTLGDQIINDFKAKNIKAYSLEPFLNQRANCTIVSQAELNAIFDHNPYWDRYYRRNPRSEGIITFSRVGFNQTRDQALLHVGSQWDRATGSGIYIMFSRQKDSSWKVESELRSWNSWNRDNPKP
ncbi:MAG: hypothetical protein KJ619_04670 [Candidatus Omnitrophica bacterium]|nr:hypothetical protein [Candidatus Omnitrophota bacterium]MBU2251492.1 hypothetical protein [Candidatus Omnitrophota bacterium]MBU2473382.1 hypothetical protein [Candidatus Omnitrophota bacterium]